MSARRKFHKEALFLSDNAHDVCQAGHSSDGAAAFTDILAQIGDK